MIIWVYSKWTVFILFGQVLHLILKTDQIRTVYIYVGDHNNCVLSLLFSEGIIKADTGAVLLLLS